MVVTTRSHFLLNGDTNKPVSYLQAGPDTNTLIVLVHGWPEIADVWKSQIDALSSLGFHVVALDLPGCGDSFRSRNKRDYTLESTNATFLALLKHLGRSEAVWIGHDWGATLVWSFVAHYPQNCIGASTMCVPYRTLEFGIKDGLIKYSNRDIYPEDEYPNAQWDYQAFYENPATWDKAIQDYEADIPNFMSLVYRKGDPSGKGKPTFTAFITKNNGWFGGQDKPPALPLDPDVLDQDTFDKLSNAYQKSGFWDISAYYLNHDVNPRYTEDWSVNEGIISVPVLFVEASYDWVCDCQDSRLAEPMRSYCRNLTEVTIAAGHWVAQEKAEQVNAALVKWIASALPASIWPYNSISPLKAHK